MGKVLDLTDLTTVYATRLLVEAGHSVLRIEPRVGDALRRLGPHLGTDSKLDLESGVYHHFYNAGKRSLSLDPSSATGREVLTRLVARAEALIGSHPLPLSEAAIRDANPNIAMVVVDDVEPELCAFARSGLLSITGQPGGEPVLLGAKIAYAATGLYAGLATAAAILAARLTGVGQTVKLSVAQSLESFMEQPMVTYLTAGTISERRGFRGAITAVSGAFRCRDGYWMVSVPHGAEGWARFMELVNDPVLASDGSLADERERLKQRDFVMDRIAEWSRGRARDEIVAEAQRRRVPASPIASPLDLVADPQLVERGFQRLLDHPVLGRAMLPQGAIATVTRVDIAPAPTLGKHNAEVLTELGYSEEAQQAMLESGVI